MKPQAIRLLPAILLAGLLGAPFAHADNIDNGSSSFIGKNEWLFLRGEFPGDTDEALTDKSIELIRRFSKVLARNDITLVFAMVPLKARIYAVHLPDGIKVSPYMAGKYERMMQALRAGNVNAIDLNGPFLKSQLRNSDTPLFLRLDTHWSPTGAMLAAETIRAGIDTDPVLKKTLVAIPEEKFEVAWAKQKAGTTLRAQIDSLPKGSPAFAEEQVLPFTVSAKKTGGSLLGNNALQITLLGTSYSAQCYGLPDALRYTLQREILAVSVANTQGSWVGMESYLRDDSFQTSRPKLLIWEIPERSMDTPPDNPYRETRYQSDNTEWLLRAAAWVQGTCTPSPVAAKVVAGGLVADAADSISAGKTGKQDFIEINFDKPIGKLDYLAARVATDGSKNLVLEASGEGVETRWFDVPVPGDGAEHVLKAPLPSEGKGFTKLLIYPGKSRAFVFKGLQMCRQSEDLLK